MCVLFQGGSTVEREALFGLREGEMGITMRWGTHDLVPILPLEELMERGVAFFRKTMMDMLFGHYE